MKFLIALGVFAAALALFTQWRAARHERQIEAAYPPQGQFVEVDGHRLHMVQMGDGPDIVLIHGASGSTREMTFALAPALAQDYRVTIMDRPGLGYSDQLTPQGASLSEQARAMSQAATQAGVRNPIILGQSYGSGVALAWALEHPASALVLVSGVAMPWTTPLDFQYRVTSSRLGSWFIVPMITAFVPDAYVERVIASIFAPQSVPVGYVEHTGPGMVLRRDSARANAKQRANLLSEIKAQYQQYSELTLPIEAVHGDADTIVPLSTHAAPFMALAPQTNLSLLAGVGHMPHQTHTDEILAAVNRAATRAGLR